MKAFCKLLSICIILLITSCSTPLNILKLSPEIDTGKWFYGQQVVSDSINGINFSVAFDRVVDEMYLFNVEIINQSNLSLLIDPADFYLEAFDAEKIYLAEHGRLNAFDPEEKIIDFDKEIALTNARENNLAALSLVGLGIDIASAVVTSTDDNPYNDGLNTDLFWALNSEKEGARFKTQSLSEIRDSWNFETIRKTTLSPGYSIQGIVFFPVNRDAGLLSFVFPVDENLVKVSFRQDQINPRL